MTLVCAPSLSMAPLPAAGYPRGFGPLRAPTSLGLRGTPYHPTVAAMEGPAPSLRKKKNPNLLLRWHRPTALARKEESAALNERWERNGKVWVGEPAPIR